MKKLYNSFKLLLALSALGLSLNASAQTTTFSTPGISTYVVPAGVTSVSVNVMGAIGGLNSDEFDYDDSGGKGACVRAYLAVTAGQVLTISVGGRGGVGTATTGGAGGSSASGYTGAPGGNFSGGGGVSGGGGGGASLILISGVPEVIAGGGGGAGALAGSNAERGGDGGGTGVGNTGGESAPSSSSASGGAGGNAGVGGAAGLATIAGSPSGTPGTTTSGGAGGANSTGGGGGGGNGGGGGGAFSGGGGGGDYVNNSLVYFATIPADTRGCNAGPDGAISITVTCTVNPITGPDSVCYNSNIRLRDVSPGGTWSTGDGSIATVSPTTGVVTGTAAGGGATLITYTTGAACLTTYLVTVNPLPPTFAAPSFVCVQSQLTTLTESVSGKWSIDDTSRAKIDSLTGVVTGDSSGSANIIFTSTAGGCSVSGLLIINAIPDSIVGLDSVCQTGSVVLTDAASPGGTWSAVTGGIVSITPAGTTAIVNGTAGGVTLISYTFPSGCAAVVSFTVDPAPSAIGGPNAICLTDTIEAETNTVLGGTWTCAPLTSATIDPVTGVIRPLVAPSSITVTYTTRSGCTKTKVVTINNIPNPITGPDNVCENSNILESTTSSGGTWSSVFTGVATVTSGGSVHGVIIAGGIDTIKYTLSSTGCFVEKIVTVNPRPAVITGQTTFCVGTPGNIISGPAGGTWTNVTAVTPTGSIDGSTGTFDPYGPGAGLDSIIYTLPTGCLRLQIVTVNPVPVISGPNQVCVSSLINLHTTITGSWSASNGDVTLSPGGPLTEVVLGASAGNVVITEVIPTTGCIATYDMTVNPLPSPVVGTNTICQLDSTLLTDPDGPGLWSVLSGGATIGSAGEVTGITPPTAVIVYSLTTTGCFTTFNLNINPAPGVFGGPSKMCIGDPAVTLTSTGGGTWTSSNTSVANIGSLSGSVTDGGTSGTTIITNTIGSTGCFRTGIFTVNALPAAISGPSTVCTGNQVTLADGSGTSTWSVSVASSPYLSVGASTGVVTGISAPGGIVTFTLPTGCSVTYPMTVNTSPANITGVLGICQGAETNLTDVTSLPSIGTWSFTPSSGIISVTPLTGVNTTSVTGKGPGTGKVTYTMANGCFRSAIVTVNAFATISGANAICQASSALYSTTGYTGTWVSSNMAAGTITSVTGVLTGISNGTTNITFTSAAGCQVEKTVTVNPLAPDTVVALGTTNLCPGGFVELTASTGAGLTYQWYNPGLVAGATASTITVTTAGTYTVHVSNGLCPDISLPTVVTVNSVIVSISSLPVATLGTVNACVSTGVTLTAGGTAGVSYQWQSSGVAIAGATNNTYTPLTDGSFSVVATNSFGCTATSNIITVNLVASPAGTVALSGAINFCEGSSVNITADAGTGYTYQWYNASGAIVGETGRTYNATTSGSYYVIDQNPTGCSTTSPTTVVTVNPLPTAAITVFGTDVFCQGGSVSLTVPTVAGETYQWYKNGVAITGALSPTYSATTSGNYESKLTLTGCSNFSATETVVEVTSPVILPLTSTTFCWGGSARLGLTIVSGAGAVTYQWLLNGVAIPGAIGSTYTALGSGIYTCSVTVTAGGGCPVTSTSATVTENPLPNPLIHLVGAEFHTQNTYVTYQWFKDGVAIVGATDSLQRCIGAGRYKVDVTDVNGCQSVSAEDPTSCAEVGVAVVAASGDIKIFPNPAQNTIQIEAPVAVRAVISSMDGRMLIDQADAKTIDISRLADGIYTIMLYDAGNHLLKADKLVKASN